MVPDTDGGKMEKLIIKNGTIVDVENEKTIKADVLCEDGIIKQVAESIIDDDAEMIDATDLIVAPGLIDGHVHFRDPGLTYKEDIYTGAEAAKRGGFTTVIMMANTKPVIDRVETLKYCLDKGAETGINVKAAACITKGMKGEELNDLDALLEAGATGFTDDGLPILKDDVIRKAMVKAAELDQILSFHEENPAFIKNNGVNHGKASEHYGIGGSDREAEINMIKRDTDLAIETGTKINIQHISSKEGVELVRQAKKKSDKIHAEATPHHFTLTEEACIKHGTLAKMNPPLREEADRKAVVEGIKDGTIDMIATDHAPHSDDEKAKPITEAPSGIIGLETSLSLAITTLVHKEGLPLPLVIKRMTKGPADAYMLKTGVIKEGYPADFCIFSETEQTTFDSFVSKANNSPFTGETLDGKIHYTIARGNIVWKA